MMLHDIQPSRTAARSDLVLYEGQLDIRQHNMRLQRCISFSETPPKALQEVGYGVMIGTHEQQNFVSIFFKAKITKD
jgi:hypothetical protein